jgi:hypothetical protein
MTDPVTLITKNQNIYPPNAIMFTTEATPASFYFLMPPSGGTSIIRR